MSSKRGNEKSRLRMDDYSDKNVRPKGVVNTRREIDKVIKKARRDGTQSAYWTKKLLEAEAKEPDRWHHSGYKELYVDDDSDSTSTSDKSLPPKDKASGGAASAQLPKNRSNMYSPSVPNSSPLGGGAAARSSSRRRSASLTTRGRNARRSASSPDYRRDSSRARTDKFSSSGGGGGSHAAAASMRTAARDSRSPHPPASYRRASRSPNPRRSPRSRSPPLRRNRSPADGGGAIASSRRRLSPPPSSSRRNNPSPSPRSRNKSPLPPTRRGRSPLLVTSSRANKSPPPTSSRHHSKADKTLLSDRRHRSLEKVSPPPQTTLRRKRSPKLPRYKSPDSASSRSPVRRRSKHRSSRSPLVSKAAAAKRAKIAHRASKYSRRSSSSDSRASSSHSPLRRKNTKQRIPEDVLSSSDCSDSNCSMCRFEKSAKEKRVKSKPEKEKPKRLPPPPEPKLKPRPGLPRLPPTSSSRYARSRSLSIPIVSSPANERRVETKHKKKSKKEKKKSIVKASKAVTSSIIHHKKIKLESPSDESESPSPKRVTLSERFGRMAKWNQKKDLPESNQRIIRVTAGDDYRVEELDVPLLEPFPEPSPLLLDGSWDDVRVRYAYYKDQGYLEDLSFQDYLKWEEWWYSYQEWLETERLHSIRRRL